MTRFRHLTCQVVTLVVLFLGIMDHMWKGNSLTAYSVSDSEGTGSTVYVPPGTRTLESDYSIAHSAKRSIGGEGLVRRGFPL
eukprot:5686186-Amphidinium_carterae.1